MPPLRMRVIERGVRDRRLVWERPVRWIDETELPALAEKHAEAMARGELDMIEFEFPDCPPDDRFFRLGVSPAGMVIPMEFKLK